MHLNLVTPLFLVSFVGGATCLSAQEPMDLEKLGIQVDYHERKPRSRHDRVYIESFGKKPIKTIGIGHNLEEKTSRKKIESLGLNYQSVLDGNTRLTDEQIQELYKLDMNDAIEDARANVKGFDALSDVRKRVVSEMVFNLGINNFRTFRKTIKHLEDVEFQSAADEMLNSRWATQVGIRATRLSRMMQTGRDHSDYGRFQKVIDDKVKYDPPPEFKGPTQLSEHPLVPELMEITRPLLRRSSKRFIERQLRTIEEKSKENDTDKPVLQFVEGARLASLERQNVYESDLLNQALNVIVFDKAKVALREAVNSTLSTNDKYWLLKNRKSELRKELALLEIFPDFTNLVQAKEDFFRVPLSNDYFRGIRAKSKSLLNEKNLELSMLEDQCAKVRIDFLQERSRLTPLLSEYIKENAGNFFAGSRTVGISVGQFRQIPSGKFAGNSDVIDALPDKIREPSDDSSLVENLRAVSGQITEQEEASRLRLTGSAITPGRESEDSNVKELANALAEFESVVSLEFDASVRQTERALIVKHGIEQVQQFGSEIDVIGDAEVGTYLEEIGIKSGSRLSPEWGRKLVKRAASRDPAGTAAAGTSPSLDNSSRTMIDIADVYQATMGDFASALVRDSEIEISFQMKTHGSAGVETKDRDELIKKFYDISSPQVKDKMIAQGLISDLDPEDLARARLRAKSRDLVGYADKFATAVELLETIGVKGSTLKTLKRISAKVTLVTDAISQYASGQYLKATLSIAKAVFGKKSPDAATLRHRQIMEALNGIREQLKEIQQRLISIEKRLIQLQKNQITIHQKQMRELLFIKAVVLSNLEGINALLEDRMAPAHRFIELMAKCDSYEEMRVRWLQGNSSFTEGFAKLGELATTSNGLVDPMFYASRQVNGFSTTQRTGTTVFASPKQHIERFFLPLVKLMQIRSEASPERTATISSSPLGGLARPAITYEELGSKLVEETNVLSDLEIERIRRILDPGMVSFYANLVLQLSNFTVFADLDHGDERMLSLQQLFNSNNETTRRVRRIRLEDSIELLEKTIDIVNVAIAQQQLMGGDIALEELYRMLTDGDLAQRKDAIDLLRQLYQYKDSASTEQFQYGGELLVKNFALYFALKRANSLVSPELYGISIGQRKGNAEFLKAVLGTARPGFSDSSITERQECEFELSYLEAPAEKNAGLSRKNLLAAEVPPAGNEQHRTEGWHIILEKTSKDVKMPLALKLPTHREFESRTFAFNAEVFGLLNLREKLVLQVAEMERAIKKPNDPVPLIVSGDQFRSLSDPVVGY